MEKFVYTVRYSARGRVRGRNFYLRAGPVIKTIIEYSINGESPFSLVFVTYSISESCRDELSSGIKASRKAIRNGMEESFLSLSFFFFQRRKNTQTIPDFHVLDRDEGLVSISRSTRETPSFEFHEGGDSRNFCPDKYKLPTRKWIRLDIREDGIFTESLLYRRIEQTSEKYSKYFFPKCSTNIDN